MARVHTPPTTRPDVVAVRLTGCGNGIGLGLNAHNTITEMAPAGAAAACGGLQLGDRVVGVDGVRLEGQALSDVLRRADTHVFEIVPRGAFAIFGCFRNATACVSRASLQHARTHARTHARRGCEQAREMS